MAQAALNSDRGAISGASELQVMHQMVEKISAGDSSKIDWKQVIQFCASSNPPRKEYLHVIADYVKLFAGGDGAPVIKYSYIIFCTCFRFVSWRFHCSRIPI